MLKKWFYKFFILERRKKHKLRAALDRLKVVAESSTKYYKQISETQKNLQKIYIEEQAQIDKLKGILSALDILTNFKLSFKEKLELILKLLLDISGSNITYIHLKDGNIISVKWYYSKRYENKTDLLFAEKNIKNFPFLLKDVLKGKSVFYNIEDIPEEEAFLISKRVKSICLMPIKISANSDELWGILGSTYFEPHNWNDFEKYILSIFSNIITGILEFEKDIEEECR